MKFTKEYFDKYNKQIKKLLKNVEVYDAWGVSKDGNGYFKITFYLGKEYNEQETIKLSKKIQKQFNLNPKIPKWRIQNQERDNFCIKTKKELKLSEKMRPHDIWRWIEIHHKNYIDFYEKGIKKSHQHLK